MSYLRLAGVAAGLLALITAFFFGRSTGIDHERTRNLATLEKARAAIERARERIDDVNLGAAIAASQQQQETRTIYERATTVIERPVYRSVCVDADGGGLLDRARTNANRGLAGEPTGPTP